MNRNRILYPIILLTLLTGSFSCSSCSNEAGDPETEGRGSSEVPETFVPNGTSVALFDYFNYKGEDDFYKQHPLTAADEFYNPILPGWYSDPSICSNGEGDYFLVASTFVYYPGVPVFHSKDLVNWKQIGNVLDRPSQLVNMAGQNTSGGIFAPAISYNPHNKTYYMITTNVGAGNFFVKTKDPFGSWSEPVYLRDVGGIDPSFFFDNDGRAYIVNNDDAPDNAPLYDGHRTIRVREFDPATDKTVGETKILVNGGVDITQKPSWIEGPHIYNIKGKYYLMAAEGGTGPNHREVIFRSDSPMGDYTPWDKNPILTQKDLPLNRQNPITCAGHADLIETKEGDWWGVFLACRPINNQFENLGRETFIMPVRWSGDGFPYMTQGNEPIPMVLKRDGVERGDETTFGNFERNDDFSGKALGYEWLTLRGPADGCSSLSDNKGYLTLKCAPADASEKTIPSLIVRRVQHHKFECSTKLIFVPEDGKDMAGILLYKDEGHQYFLAVNDDASKRYVSLEKVDEKKVGGSDNKEIVREVLGRAAVNDRKSPIQLKVASQGAYFDFYYTTEEGRWKMLCGNVEARHLSTANSFGFTGTTIGMYATKRP